MSVSSPKVAFVYHNARRALAAQVEHGDAPDSTLLGQNHMAELGIDARIHDPVLTRGGGEPNRLLWNLREVMLPWELRGVDVVVTPLANLFPIAARARRSPRVVLVNYGLCTIYARASRARRRLIDSMVRSVEVVVALADWQREKLREQTGIRPERGRTIHLGIDERYFAPRPVADGSEPLIVSVGKDPARDYATLAAAVERIDARLEIAAYPRNLAGVTLPRNARARVLSSGEVRDLCARATCIVLPQRRHAYPYGSEGGGLTALLEAMALARPVVATDRPVIREYVADEETALVVPPEDPASMRAAIERVLQNRQLGESLGAAGRARVETEHTTRRFAERLAGVLREVGAR